MTVSVDEFKKSLQLWASGITVVTTSSDKYGIQGMTVTAFSSVSVNPPQILVCINNSADTGEGIQESHSFAVNILSSNQEKHPIILLVAVVKRSDLKKLTGR